MNTDTVICLGMILVAPFVLVALLSLLLIENDKDTCVSIHYRKCPTCQRRGELYYKLCDDNHYIKACHHCQRLEAEQSRKRRKDYRYDFTEPD